MIDMIGPLLALGSRAILLKGGHLSAGNSDDKATDFYHDGSSLHRLESNWIKTVNTHGTGCTLSSAITALLARGYSMSEAIQRPKSTLPKPLPMPIS